MITKTLRELEALADRYSASIDRVARYSEQIKDLEAQAEKLKRDSEHERATILAVRKQFEAKWPEAKAEFEELFTDPDLVLLKAALTGKTPTECISNEKGVKK